MRYVVVPLIIAAILMVAFGVSVNHYLTTSAEKISVQLRKIERDINDNRWGEVKSSLKKVQEDWTGMKKWWAVFIDHHEIDNIDQSLAQAKEYIRSSNQTLSLAEIAVLKLFVKHIPEKESFNIENIL